MILYQNLRRPEAGQPLKVSWGDSVVAAIKSLTPISGKNVRLTRTNTGTVIDVDVPQQTPTSQINAQINRMPFDLIVDNNGDTYVWNGASTAMVYVGQYTATNENVDPTEEMWLVHTNTSGKACSVWVFVDWHEPTSSSSLPPLGNGNWTWRFGNEGEVNGAELAICIGSVSSDGKVTQIHHGCIYYDPSRPRLRLFEQTYGQDPSSATRLSIPIVTSITLDNDGHVTDFEMATIKVWALGDITLLNPSNS